MNKFAGTIAILFLLCVACDASRSDKKKPLDARTVAVQKPPSSFTDTFTITSAAAVFFQPDSIQWQKIRAVTDSTIFKGSMHEYAYQIKNAREFFKINWPHLKLFSTIGKNFILFKASNEVSFLVDLNTRDPCGLFVFDGNHSPQLIDMTNIETQVPQYFSQNLSEGAK